MKLRLPFALQYNTILMALVIFITPLTANNITEYKIKNNDTVLSIFKNNQIPLTVYFNLPAKDKEVLDNIRADYQAFVVTDDDNNTKQMLIQVNAVTQASVKKDAQDVFGVSFIPIEFETKTKILHNTIQSSPYSAITQIDSSFSDLAEEFRAIFFDSIDFTRDVRKGDNLYILYEETLRLSKKVKPPRILAAMIETGRKEHYVYYYNDQYYTQGGTALQHFSLLPPVASKVSSPFSLGRPHPILHIVRPHHGVDYRARRGQRIKAAMDGKVIFRGWRGGYGKTVVIQHNKRYKTLYAHLDKFSSQTALGKRVVAGKTIGVAGKTGLATGYHLHFGLYSKGEPINPAKFINKGDGFLRGSELKEFHNHTAIYKNKMKNIYSSTAEVNLH